MQAPKAPVYQLYVYTTSAGGHAITPFSTIGYCVTSGRNLYVQLAKYLKFVNDFVPVGEGAEQAEDFSLRSPVEIARSESSFAAVGPEASAVPLSNSMKSFVEDTHFHCAGSYFLDGSLQLHSQDVISGIGPSVPKSLPVNEPVVGLTPEGAVHITEGSAGLATPALFFKHFNPTSFVTTEGAQSVASSQNGSVVRIVPFRVKFFHSLLAQSLNAGQTIQVGSVLESAKFIICPPSQIFGVVLSIFIYP